eukprot:gene3634-2569_t
MCKHKTKTAKTQSYSWAAYSTKSASQIQLMNHKNRQFIYLISFPPLRHTPRRHLTTSPLKPETPKTLYLEEEGERATASHAAAADRIEAEKEEELLDAKFLKHSRKRNIKDIYYPRNYLGNIFMYRKTVGVVKRGINFDQLPRGSNNKINFILNWMIQQTIL